MKVVNLTGFTVLKKNMSLVFIVLQLLYNYTFKLHVMLLNMLNVMYFYNNNFQSMCAMPNMAVFCIFLISFFPDILLKYILDESEIISAAPVITGTLFLFTFACAVLLMQALCILEPSRLLSSSHFCHMKLPHLLIFVFLFIITEYDIRSFVRYGSVRLH